MRRVIITKPLIEVITTFKRHNNGLTAYKKDSEDSRRGHDTVKVHYHEAVDYTALKRYFINLLSHQPGGLVVSHTNAECSTLSRKEHLKITKAAIDLAGNTTPVIASVGSNSTTTAIEYSMEVESLGASVILHGLPYYNRPPVEGVMLHLRSIRKFVTKPIWISVNFGRSNAEITVDAILTLAKERVIQAVIIEECDDDFSQRLIRQRPKDFQVFTVDRFMPNHIRLGAKSNEQATGVMSSIANFDYELIAKALEALKNNDEGEWHKHANKLTLLSATMMQATQPAPLKAMLSISSNDHNELLRPPLVSLGGEQRPHFIHLAREYGYRP